MLGPGTRARSLEEVKLWLQLHPHGCGERRPPSEPAVEGAGDARLVVIDGLCPRCGERRREQFRFAPPPDRPSWVPSRGDEPASELIDAGEYLIVAEGHASGVVDASPKLSLDELDAACGRLRDGVAALREVLRFIPYGKSWPPDTAFWSDLGKALHRAAPHRFERSALQAQLDAWNARWGRHAQAAGERRAPEFHARNRQLASDIVKAMGRPEPEHTLVLGDHQVALVKVAEGRYAAEVSGKRVKLRVGGEASVDDHPLTELWAALAHGPTQHFENGTLTYEATDSRGHSRQSTSFTAQFTLAVDGALDVTLRRVDQDERSS